MGAASTALSLLGRPLFFLLCVCTCPEGRRSGPQLQNQIAAWGKTEHFFPRKTGGGEPPGEEGEVYNRKWGIHAWVPMQLWYCYKIFQVTDLVLSFLTLVCCNQKVQKSFSGVSASILNSVEPEELIIAENLLHRLAAGEERIWCCKAMWRVGCQMFSTNNYEERITQNKQTNLTTLITYFIPVLHCIERVFTGDIIHEDEAHSSSVVGCSDGPVSFLSSCILEQRRIFRL